MNIKPSVARNYTKIISHNLNRLFNEKNINREQISKDLNIGYSTLSNWLLGYNAPKMDKIQKIAEYLNVNITDIITKNNINYKDVDYDIINEDDNFIRMPIIGSVPAGIPIEAIEDYDGELMVPMSHLKGSRSDYMLITVKGDSMYPKYLDGDIILVRKNPSPDSGKDCIVFVNDEDATLKTFYKDKKGITLKPINPMYKEMHFTPEEVNSNNIRVLGVAVSLEYRKL